MLLDSSRDVLFLSAKRTAFGAFGGALKDLRATDLGTIAAQAALAQADVRRRRDRRGHLRQRASDDARGHVLRAPHRPARRLARRDARADRQPAVRLGVPVDRHRGAGDPHRRRRDGAGRRHRIDEPGAARHPRRALGLPVRQGAARRGSAVDRAHRQLRRLPDGRRPPRPSPSATASIATPATRTRCSRRSAGPRPTKPGGSAKRSRPSSCAAARARRRPSRATSTRGRRPRSRGWPSWRRCSRPTAPSPPATPRVSPTAPPRWSSRRAPPSSARSASRSAACARGPTSASIPR